MPSLAEVGEAATLLVRTDPAAVEAAAAMANEARALLGRSFSVTGDVLSTVTKPAATNDAASLASYQHLLEQMKLNGVSVGDTLQSASSESALLGSGREHSVFAIGKLPDYALRVLRLEPIPLAEPLEPIVDPLPNLNIGQPVAKIGNAEIVKRVAGTQYGPDFLPDKGLTIDQFDQAYADAIRTASKMPQKAYDAFAHTLVATDRVGLHWDGYNFNNILIDADAERFNPVDFAAKTADNRPHGLTTMVASLADPMRFSETDMMFSVPTYVPSLGAELTAIIEKSTAAALKEGLPIEANRTSNVFLMSSPGEKFDNWLEAFLRQAEQKQLGQL